MIVLRLVWRLFSFADHSLRWRPSRAVSLRASASAAAAGADDPLARRAARARARPRCWNLRTVSPQSTGLSYPLSVLMQRLATGGIFVVIPSGAGSPTSDHPGSSAALTVPSSWGPVRATVRWGSIYDIFHTPDMNMPPTGFVAMTYDTYVHFIISCFRRKEENFIQRFCTYERDEFSGHRPPGHLIQLRLLRQGACPPESCWVAERASCGLQGQHGFHCNYNCCVWIDRGPRASENNSGFCLSKNEFCQRDVSCRRRPYTNLKATFPHKFNTQTSTLISR